MIGIRLGKLIAVNYDKNTVDVLMTTGYGILRGVHVAFPLASTHAGVYEMPVLKTVTNEKGAVYIVGEGKTKDIENVYPLENKSLSQEGLEDSSSNYAYAVIVGADELVGKNIPVCIGFLYPHRNELIFDPDHPPAGPAYVQEAIKQLKGALLHRTNSGVYWVVDANANFEWFHPNGSFFRIAETPTQEKDGAVHVDLTGKNTRSDKQINFDPTLARGTDGTQNSTRAVYAHLEVKTKKGVVEIDINKDTGNVTIKTPQDSAAANSSSNNKLNIICGGDALLQSVKGNVTIESVSKQVLVSAAAKVTVDSPDIVLAPDSKPDFLPLFTALAKKFNAHTHGCKGTGKATTGPSEQLKQGEDSTDVTKAG